MYNFDTLVDRCTSDSVKWKTISSCHSVAWPDVLPLWIADMDFASPPEVTEALAARAGHPVYGYSARPEELFAAYTGWMRKRHGTTVEAEWLSFSPGIVPALGTAIRAFSSPGDGVAIMPPVYHPFKNMIEKNRRAVVEAPLVIRGGRYEIDFDALDAACARSKLLILCSPHNPVGRVWTAPELAGIAEIAERRNIVVLADEIHGDLVYDSGAMLPSLKVGAGLSRRLIAAWAPSKTFNIAGIQASIIVMPDPELKARFDLESDATGIGSPNCMVQAAAVTAYTRCEPWLDEALAYMRGNYDTLVKGLAERAPRLKVFPCEGTYLAWIDFSAAGLSGDIGAEVMNRAGLWLDSGARFGTGGGGFARLNMGCPRSIIKTAVERLGRAFP